jgi:hypothetical protein
LGVKLWAITYLAFGILCWLAGIATERATQSARAAASPQEADATSDAISTPRIAVDDNRKPIAPDDVAEYESLTPREPDPDDDWPNDNPIAPGG